MRLSTGILLGSLSLASFAAHATETLELEKVKKGILPSGGFYSLYEVECKDQSTSSVASTHRQSRWCTNYGGQLSCFRSSQEASHMACSGMSVTDSGQDS